MLEVAHMGLHVAQITGQATMRQCFEAVTTPARIMELQGYGLTPGCHADFVLLQAHDPVKALRLSGRPSQVDLPHWASPAQRYL